MYNTFSIKPTYNTFSYHNIHTNNKTIIPIELTSPILGILIEQSLPQLNNDNKVINMHKENITHIVNKNTQCTCISVNMLTLLHDINFNNVNEIMKKIALFFLINDMVNYYYREQEDITFHQLSNSPKIMASIYDNYINFKVNHNDVSCDLARIILQNNQKSQNNYQNNVK